MPRSRERDRFTNWHNDEPITDLCEALELLSEGQRDSIDGRFLYTGGKQPDIHVGWYTHGDSGGDRSGLDYFEVDPALAAQLISERWVEPRQVPEWGHTRTERHKLVLSYAGKEKLKTLIDAERAKARGLLIPCEHSKFSGIFNPTGHGRDKWRHGRLYFTFTTPMKEDGRIKVYPSTGVVEKLGDRGY